MPEADADDLVFRALADPRRRRMLDLIRDRPVTTGALCAAFSGEIDRCTVMQHLGVLERAGLLIARREGRTRWNHFDPSPIRRIHGRWITPWAEGPLGALERMRGALEV